MAFDEALASRIRSLVAASDGIAEKKMFGGLAFLVHGNMSVGIHGADLIVRIDPDEANAALKEPGARICDITGRPMKGWLLVASSALARRSSLTKWVDRGVTHARSLPPK